MKYNVTNDQTMGDLKRLWMSKLAEKVCIKLSMWQIQVLHFENFLEFKKYFYITVGWIQRCKNLSFVTKKIKQNWVLPGMMEQGGHFSSMKVIGYISLLPQAIA